VRSDFIEFIGNARKRRTDRFRVQLSVFLVCLVISVFLWALVRLSRDYFYSVEYKLRFTETPTHLNLVSCSDSILTLRIRLQGFDLFSEQFLINHHREYDVSLRNTRIRYMGERVYGYMLTNRIGREIVSSSNFPSDVFIALPDTLFFEFERQSNRKSR